MNNWRNLFSSNQKARIQITSLVHSSEFKLKMSETYLFRWAKPSLNCSTRDYRIWISSSSSMTFGCCALNLLYFSDEIRILCVYLCVNVYAWMCECVCVNAFCVQEKFQKVISQCVHSLLCLYCNAVVVFWPVSPCVISGWRCLITLVVACSFLSHPAPQEWI